MGSVRSQLLQPTMTMSKPSTILITGANSGIGLAASKLVALKDSTKKVILGELGVEDQRWAERWIDAGLL